MPDPLDVAKQRKLIEELKRGGETAQDAEGRLRDMIEIITSVRSYRPTAAGKPRQKVRHDQSDSMAG
jgi:hypothetical protein